VVASSYPFLDVMWTMLVFFAWVIWFWLLITVFGDVFRRRDLSGWGKAGWIIFVIVLPYLGVLIYLIAEHDGMAERNAKQMEQSKAQMDDYVRSVSASSDPAEQIGKGKKLLDDGAITQAEFDALKQKVLAQAS
jgi:Phospholipase_D-nuclease N-terminal/Short C-terminal domain